MQQTEERKEYLRRHALAQKCEEQMQHGDYQLPACQNMTVRANIMDLYTLTADYHNVPVSAKNTTYKLYSALRQLVYPYMSENVYDVHNKDDRIEIQARLAADLKSMNTTLTTPRMNVKLTNLRVNRWVRPVIAMHPTMTLAERLGKKALRDQYARKLDIAYTLSLIIRYVI